MSSQASSSDAPRVFPNTRWSVVLAATRTPSPESAAALELICQAYWYPLYAYVRRCGQSPHDAQDLTQEFFCRLLAKRWLDSADREKGRLRSFLIVALKKFMSNEWDCVSAQRRGGGQVQAQIDTAFAESRFATDSHSLAPDETFDRQWALTLISLTTNRLRREFTAAGKPDDYDTLKTCLLADRGAIDYATVARQLGVNEGAARVAVHRLRKFTPEEALAIVPPLCDALQFAHDRGIVHRDIKPENLLLDKTGKVKVADFGIAKMLGTVNGNISGEFVSPENVTQSAVGTPSYSAPELKTDPQRVDSRADIYSLGVVFYEILTGELPGKQLQPPSKKVQIDVRLDEIVLRALEKKPELRFQQVSEVKTLVETIVATPPGSSRREEAQTESGRQKAGSGKPGENRGPSAATELNPWQPVIALMGMFGCMILFIIGFILPFPANLIPFVIAPIGIIVAGLKLAGFWPWPSPLGTRFRACGITQFPNAVLPVPSQIRVIREIRGQSPASSLCSLAFSRGKNSPFLVCC